jgi:hypothetical protein
LSTDSPPEDIVNYFSFSLGDGAGGNPVSPNYLADLLELGAPVERFPSERFPSGNLPSGIVPRSPGSPGMPDSDTVNLCIDIYFLQADITVVMLHKAVFQAMPEPPALFLYSVLLMAPHMTRDMIPGRETGEQVRNWDRTFFQKAKMELFALLTSGVPVTIEAVAAVVNLYLWGMFKGLTVLARQLLALAKKLLVVMGLIADQDTMRPAQGFLSWKETMELAFGPDVATRSDMSTDEVSRLRFLWIQYWTRERVTQLVMYLNWVTRDWTRIIDLDGSNTDPYADLRRPMPPMPPVWESSFAGDFDPRGLAEPPTYEEMLMPLLADGDGPEVEAGFRSLTEHLAGERKAVAWCFMLMRDKVDRFLSACREAGVSTPVMLPLDGPGDERTAPLLRTRKEISDKLLRLREAFPELVKQALKNGSAREIVAVLMEKSGSFYYAFNHVTYFPAIVLLRLELYSSCGVFLTYKAVQGAGENQWADQDTLADEFGVGGDLFSEFLEDVLLFTRLLEDWKELNPEFTHHLEANLVLIFRICCLHASFYKKFRRSFNQGLLPQAAAEDILNQVAKDIVACLSCLAQYAKISKWTSAVYVLAQKMANEQNISVMELHGIRQHIDLPEHDEASGEDETEEEEGGIVGEARQLQNMLGVYETLGAALG